MRSLDEPTMQKVVTGAVRSALEEATKEKIVTGAVLCGLDEATKQKLVTGGASFTRASRRRPCRRQLRWTSTKPWRQRSNNCCRPRQGTANLLPMELAAKWV